jgi:hypothetical protein
MAVVVEDVLLAMKTWLTTGLPGALDAITAEKADGITLDHPKTIEVTTRVPYGWSEYPVVLLSADRSDFKDLAMGLQEAAITIAVVVGLVEGDPDNMAKVSLRYAEAIRALMRDDYTIGSAVDRARVTVVEYVPAMPGDLTVHVAVLTVEAVKAIPG